MAITQEKWQQEKWQAVRASVKETGDRFLEFVSSAPDPDAKVTEEWSVVDTLAHVTAIAWMYTTMVRSDDTPLPISGLDEVIAVTTVDTVSTFNDVTLQYFGERNRGELVKQLHTSIDEILWASADLDPTKPVGWLGGAQVPLAGILAHLVNEMLVHGHDISRGIRLPWAIPSKDAALFFDLFLVGVIGSDVGRLLDNGGPAQDRRIAVNFRSRYTTPVALVLQRGEVSVEEPSRGNDMTVYFEPAMMNLMLFHRVSTPRAALSGKVRVWGRRPWLLPTFMRTVRLP